MLIQITSFISDILDQISITYYFLKLLILLFHTYLSSLSIVSRVLFSHFICMFNIYFVSSCYIYVQLLICSNYITLSDFLSIGLGNYKNYLQSLKMLYLGISLVIVNSMLLFKASPTLLGIKLLTFLFGFSFLVYIYCISSILVSFETFSFLISEYSYQPGGVLIYAI
jgi:hypothetical protein